MLEGSGKVVVLNILCTKFKTPVFLHVNVQNWKQLSKYGSLDRLILIIASHIGAHTRAVFNCCTISLTRTIKQQLQNLLLLCV